MANKVDFNPSFVVWSCPHCSDDVKASNCVSDGKYCAHTSYYNSQAYNGRSVIQENLREHCIHKLAKENKEAELFFEYIAFVHEKCKVRIDEKCSKEGVKSIGYDFSKVNACVADTFGSSGTDINYNSDN